MLSRNRKRRAACLRSDGRYRTAGWSKNAPDLPDVSTCSGRIHAGRLLLCMGLFFDILGARTFEGKFSNVSRSYAGKGTVRYNPFRFNRNGRASSTAYVR
jgi:hypothetical protein